LSAAITCRSAGRAHALLRRQADLHVARGAEVLHLHVRIAELADGLAHLADVGGLRIADLHHGAARELHRQVQPAVEQEEHRRNANVANEMMLNTSAFRMNGMSRRILKNSMALVLDLTSAFSHGGAVGRRAARPCRSTPS
jgi:hypothetical protein